MARFCHVFKIKFVKLKKKIYNTMKVLFFLFFTLVFSFEWDDPIGVDQLFLLGYQRIKAVMRTADDWRLFHVHWRHDAWPEDVLRDLWNLLRMKGFELRWIKRGKRKVVKKPLEKSFNNSSMLLVSVSDLNDSNPDDAFIIVSDRLMYLGTPNHYDAFEFKCVDEPLFRKF
jgi:hypothetical protein